MFVAIGFTQHETSTIGAVYIAPTELRGFVEFACYKYDAPTELTLANAKFNKPYLLANFFTRKPQKQHQRSGICRYFGACGICGICLLQI